MPTAGTRNCIVCGGIGISALFLLSKRFCAAPEHWPGIALLVSGCLHGAIGLAIASDWAGPLSIRKPILFGLSGGATSLSLAWVSQKLDGARWAIPTALLTGIALCIEIALVTLQYWRGVASHFNRSSAFDQQVLAAMLFVIAIATVGILLICIRSFGRLSCDRAMASAIRSGMALLFTGCVLGFVIENVGEKQAALGRSPSVYGEAGVLKFPHGMPLHAIQFLPAIVELLRRGRCPTQVIHRAVRCSAFGIAMLTVYAVIQTSKGRPRFHTDAWGWSLLVAGMIMTFAPLILGFLRATLLVLTARFRTIQDPEGG